MSLFEKPDTSADRKASRSERFAALFQSQTLPAAIARTAATPVAVLVINDAPAVTPDMVESIFQMYVSAHEPLTVTGSMGLGLAVSRQLARLMGGDIVYERRDGTTVFRLTLPCAQSD